MAKDVALRKQQAIATLLDPAHRTVEAAAAAAGLTPRQMWRYLADPAFKADLLTAQTELNAVALRRLTALQSEAIDTLRGILASDAHPSIKRATANDVLHHAARLAELLQLSERVSALEAALAQAQAQPAAPPEFEIRYSSDDD